MSATNTLETGLLELILQNVDTNAAISALGDGLQAATTAGSIYVALFTADPTDAGTQTNECAYGAYARVAVARSSGGWAVSGDTGDNVAAVTFPEATSGTETATHFGLMSASSAGEMFFHGALDSGLAISTNVQPEFAIGVLDITAD